MKLINILKALVAIAMSAAILLILDLDNRKSEAKKENYQIAVYKMASRSISEEAEKGVTFILAERGYAEGQKELSNRVSQTQSPPIGGCRG